MRFLLPALSLFLGATFAAPAAELVKPFLIPRTATTGWVIGNGLWNITIGDVYGKKLFYGGRDLIGDAVGHYSGYGEKTFLCSKVEVVAHGLGQTDLTDDSMMLKSPWGMSQVCQGFFNAGERSLLTVIANDSLPTNHRR